MNLRYGIRFASLAAALLTLLVLVIALTEGDDTTAGDMALMVILTSALAGLTIERKD